MTNFEIQFTYKRMPHNATVEKKNVASVEFHVLSVTPSIPSLYFPYIFRYDQERHVFGSHPIKDEMSIPDAIFKGLRSYCESNGISMFS